MDEFSDSAEGGATEGIGGSENQMDSISRSVPRPPQAPTSPAPQMRSSLGMGLVYITLSIILIIIMAVAILYISKGNKGSVSAIVIHIPGITPKPAANLTNQTKAPSLNTSAGKLLNLFESYNKNATHLEITYSFYIPSISALLNSVYPQGKGNVIVYTYISGNNTKALVQLGPAVSAIYRINNTGPVISCSQGSLESQSGTNVNCTATTQSLVSSSSLESVVKKGIAANQINVSFVGNSSIAGRECSLFSLSFSPGAFANITSSYSAADLQANTSSTQPSGRYNANGCVDDQYGYISYMNLTSSYYSQLSNKNINTTIAVIRVTNTSTSFNNSVFNIPVPVVMSSFLCNSNTLYSSLFALQKATNATFTINSMSMFSGNALIPLNGLKEKASLGNTTYGQYKNVTFKLSKNQTLSQGIYAANWCTLGQCSQSVCLVTTPISTTITNSTGQSKNSTK